MRNEYTLTPAAEAHALILDNPNAAAVLLDDFRAMWWTSYTAGLDALESLGLALDDEWTNHGRDTRNALRAMLDAGTVEIPAEHLPHPAAVAGGAL